MRKILLIILDIIIGTFVFGGLLLFGFLEQHQQPALLVVLVLGIAFLVVLRIAFDQKETSAPHPLVSSQPSYKNKDSSSEGRDDQPLLILKPSPDSPRRRSPRSIFLIGVAWLPVCITLGVLMIFVWRIDFDDTMFVYIVMAVVTTSLLMAHCYVSVRGGYDISYEFYERGLKYNYMEYNFNWEKPPKQRSRFLPYFDISGVELAPRPSSSDDKFVDIHVAILTSKMRQIMCGVLNPKKEFFLYDIPAAEHPIVRIREILDAYHKNNPGAAELASRHGEV